MRTQMESIYLLDRLLREEVAHAVTAVLYIHESGTAIWLIQIQKTTERQMGVWLKGILENLQETGRTVWGMDISFILRDSPCEINALAEALYGDHQAAAAEKRQLREVLLTGEGTKEDRPASSSLAISLKLKKVSAFETELERGNAEQSRALLQDITGALKPGSACTT